MRKGGEMNVLMLACAGGVMAALVAVAADLRKRRSLQERLDRHLKWHEMEAESREKILTAGEKALIAGEKALVSLEGILLAKQPEKKPAAKKAAPKKGGKKG